MTASRARAGNSPSGAPDAVPLGRRKPLYLLARKTVEVRVEDASLAFYGGKVPMGRCPAARLARIVASDRVHWRGQALALCFAEGIPIQIVDLRGGLLGSCVPARVRVSPLSELLDELTAEARWQPIYENLLRHLRSRVLKCWAADCAAAGQPLTDCERGEWVRSFVQGAKPPLTTTFDCRALLRSIVERQLHRASVRSHYWCEGGVHLDLAGDIADILYGHLLMYGGSLFTGLSDPGPVVRLFENDVLDNEGHTTRLLASLQRLLLRRVHRWQ